MSKEKETGNSLFPIFLKLNKIQILLVGGGYVGLEKLNALLKNDARANVKVLAPHISEQIVAHAKKHSNIQLVHEAYHSRYLKGVNLVIVATNDPFVNAIIYLNAKEMGILCNVADTPHLCDFYLGSTVKKGDLKIGISTNGKSPTLAKRIRELLEDSIPDQTNNLLEQLNAIRSGFSGDFEEKVNFMNHVTASMMKDFKDKLSYEKES